MTILPDSIILLYHPTMLEINEIVIRLMAVKIINLNIEIIVTV